jgi:polysaccharide biosynthesis transport protein
MNDSSKPVAAAAAPAAFPWAVPGRKIDLQASLLAHRRLAAWVGATIAALGLVIALIAGHPKYLAEASVRISPNFPKTLQEDGEPYFNSNADYRDYVQQQVAEIESPQTTADALTRLGSRRTLWQRPGETDFRAAERLMWALKVQTVTGTYLITIGLEGQRPDALAEIVNAVVDAYLARQQGQELNGSDQRVQMLLSRRSQLVSQIDAQRMQESRLAAELGVSTFTPGFLSPYDKIVDDANAALYAAGRKLIEAQARLAALQDHQERVNQLEVDSDAQQILANDHEVAAANATLAAQRQAAVIELQGLGAHHPGRPALEQEISDIDAAIAQTNQAAMRSLRAMLIQNRETKQRQAMSEAQARVDEARLATAGIDQEVGQLRASSAAFGTKYNQALSNSDEIDRLQKEVQAIDDRVNFLRLEAPSPGFVRIESPAQTPDIALKGGRRKILALFWCAALILAAAVPAGIDLIDPKIKTADELEAILGFAPLGIVEEGALGFAPPGAVEERTARLARESLRRVAFAIIREWRASGVRRFVLVPVRDRAGTTALALALARELTRIGRPAVAIEANQFSPDPRYGTSLAPGFGTVPESPCTPSWEPNGNSNGHTKGFLNLDRIDGGNGGASIAYASTSSAERRFHSIVNAEGGLPDRIPICRHFGGPGLTLECVECLVALALATNDLVILDAPGLNDSGDAEMLIQMPAAALLVVRKDRDPMPEVVAAARALEKLSPPVVGAILNGIARDAGSLQEPPIGTSRALTGNSASSAVEESSHA